MNKVWKNIYLVRVYEYAKDGLSERQIAKQLGVAVSTFRLWETKRPLFKMHLEEGRKYYRTASGKGMTVGDYIYGRLPRKLKKVWKDLKKLDEADSPLERVEALFENRGKKTRQHLFLHAVANNFFSRSQACRVVGIGRDTFERWKRDPDFIKLFDEIERQKKDFVESHNLKLIASGDTAATIAANSTVNRDRGYGKQVDVNVTGELEINHNIIRMEDLKLPIKVRKDILAAIREKSSA